MNRDCGIERMSKDAIRRKYEGMAKWYDAQDSIYELLAVGKLRADLIPRASGKILEVAAGTGKNFEYYPVRSHITAIDNSPAMIAQARKKAQKVNSEVELRIMDAEELTFPNESFDTVVSTLTGCTFPDPEKVYREMIRVCRPNGRILLIEHGVSSVSWLSFVQHKLAKAYYKKYACLWNRDALTPIRSLGLRIAHTRVSFFGIFHAFQLHKSSESTASD